MPELPEVETVRRGLAPVLEGAVIERVEQRRPDLRFPLPKRFAARLEGRRVDGAPPPRQVSARRARRRQRAPHASRHVRLVPHRERKEKRVRGRSTGDLYYGRPKDEAHDHVVLHLKGGLRIVYNDPRRFGFMLLVSPRDLEKHPLLKGLGLEPTGNALSAEALAPRFTGPRRAAEGGALRPEGDRRPRQHLCLRGAVAGAALAAPRRRHAGPRRRQADRAAGAGWSRRYARSSPTPSRRAARRFATTSRRTASSASSSIASPSTTARAKPVPATTAARSAASFSPGARPSIVRSASGDGDAASSQAELQGGVMAYENILVERRGKVGPDPTEPPAGAERAVEGVCRRSECRACRVREG